MKMPLYWCFIALLLLVGCGPKQLRLEERQVPEGAPDPAQPPAEFYTVGAGDVLNVVVWNEPSLSGPVTVRPDGFVTLPLINEVQVVGLTTTQVRELLTQKFGSFVMSPSVTVRVERIASSELLLLGEVAKPGAYPAVGNESLLQVLTKAGGLTIFADRHNIRIVRRLREKLTEYIVDYDAILKGDLKQDILLRPGDRIIVP